jgi:glucose/arabinose dehydrogenase
MSRKLLLLSLISLVMSLTLTASHSGSFMTASIDNWPFIILSQISGGYEAPVHITHAGDGSGRLFIVEQRGRILIINNGAPGGEFLNITDRVRSPLSGGGGEEGLLSVAFPPGFGSGKDHFYVYYTRTDGNNQVSRFSLSVDPMIADPNSEEVILTINHPAHQNHNGGQLIFGNDGFLYIGTGDGGGGGDPDQNAQDPSSLLGKLLRIDVEAGVKPYKIPPSNPFVGLSGYREEIWALGLRNPWRFSTDRQNGDLYIGDVGQGSWEEVNQQPGNNAGGTNYGWNILEGFDCYGASSCDDTGLTYPVYVYPTHVDGSCSITGGYVYRGQEYPGLFGIDLYADYCNGKIWGLREQSGIWNNHLFLDTPFNISTFGEDEGGNLYFADRSSGNIYQIQALLGAEIQYLPIINRH